MTEERIVERTDGISSERVTERGAPSTTIVERRGGGGGLLIGLAALIAVLIVGYMLIAQNNREDARTEAVTKVVGDAGDAVAGAADKVGTAADKAADKLEGNK